MDGINQDDSVRELAYRLWEDDGRPDGRDQEFWFRAEALLVRGQAGLAEEEEVRILAQSGGNGVSPQPTMN